MTEMSYNIKCTFAEIFIFIRAIVQKYNLVHIVRVLVEGQNGLSWLFQHLVQGSSCLLLLNTAVPTESMTMAFVEPDECISIFSLYISFFFIIIISFLDFMSRIAVIWISSPELSYVCHTYAMPICAPMRAKNS